jgi:hypothetical protein
MLRKFALSSFLVIAGTGILAAQNSTLSSEVQQAWTRTKTNLLAAVEKMPEESYSFKPAPESELQGSGSAHSGFRRRYLLGVQRRAQATRCCLEDKQVGSGRRVEGSRRRVR